MKYLYINIITAACLLWPNLSEAWSGTDQDGETVEIEKGNLVREGLDIEVYYDNDGEYHNVSVDTIRSYGYNVEIEGYDNDTGEYITLDMER
jgi:hypothetical protein